MSCYLCWDDEVALGDRWKFNFGDDEFYLCRGCYDYFTDIHHFEQFIQDWNRQKLFRAVRAMTRLIAQGAPHCLIAHQADVVFQRCTQDEKILPHLKFNRCSV